MSDSLRDQLMGLGFKPAPKPERAKPQGGDRRPDSGRPGQAQHKDGGRAQDARRGGPGRSGAPGRPGPSSRPGAPGGGKPRSREDIDLAKAYAIRAQREKDERIAAEAAKQEEARKRREARARLAELLKDRTLNVADADIARHFPYGGKIKRVYVTAEQLRSLNAGELGVVQVDGRYALVTAEVLAQAEAVFAPAIALKVDPNAPAEDDPYADPKYQVPDDLVW